MLSHSLPFSSLLPPSLPCLSPSHVFLPPMSFSLPLLCFLLSFQAHTGYTVRVKKTFTCPFRLTDRPFPLYFLSQLRPHPFNIRLISACVLSPFVRKNGHFGARFSARVNCYSVGRTARELDTKRRILFFHAKGYRAPTITMRADDETTVQEVLGRWSRHQRQDAR